MDDLDQFAADGRIEFALEQQFGKAQHARHRRAQFVGGGGEVAPAPFVGGAVMLFGGAPLRNVAHRHRELRARRPHHAAIRKLDREAAAVQAPRQRLVARAFAQVTRAAQAQQVFVHQFAQRAPGQQRAGRAEQLLGCRVRGHDIALRIEHQDAVGQVGHQRLFPAFGRGATCRPCTQFIARNGGQVAQRGHLLVIEMAHLAVDHAQRANPAAVRRGQRNAGIEAHVRRTGDERVVGKAGIETRVVDHQAVLVLDRVGAERGHARGFVQIDPHARLEPLAVGVDQRDQRNGHTEQATGQTRDAVEPFFGRGVEQGEFVQRAHAGLVGLGDGLRGRQSRGNKGVSVRLGMHDVDPVRRGQPPRRCH